MQALNRALSPIRALNGVDMAKAKKTAPVTASGVALMACFTAQAAGEALGVRAEELARDGRVHDVYADLWASLDLPLVAKGGKGASPRGAHARLQELCAHDKPALKDAHKGWLS